MQAPGNRGEARPASALDFAWFAKVFPRAHLTVVCATPFEADRVRGVTLEEFLTEKA